MDEPRDAPASSAPETAGEQWPIRAERAAEKLHVGVRRLKEHARRHGIGRIAGKVMIFSEEDFQALYDTLPVPGGDRSRLSPNAARQQRRIEELLARSRKRKRGAR